MTNNRLTRDDLASINIPPYFRRRMAERQVTELDVARTLVNPDIIEAGAQRGHRPYVRYVRGDLVVVFNPASRDLVTLLLRSASQWDDHDMRKRDR